MYLDLEEKFGNKDSTRNLYERCISLSMKPKKMKFFFKRFLDFEIKQGSAERIDYVKTKAQEYVESMLGKNENEI
jgi:rRNA biogenesis protein RRP5